MKARQVDGRRSASGLYRPAGRPRPAGGRCLAWSSRSAAGLSVSCRKDIAMDDKTFKKLTEARIVHLKRLLRAKSTEYAHGDRLSNFKQAANLMQTTPEKALAGMLVKHVVALFDFINELDSNKLRPYTYWNEKISDTQAYLFLLDALIVERINEDASDKSAE